MINLQEFVQTIHTATAAAGEALIQKNLGLIDQFFEPVEDEPEQPASGNARKAAINSRTETQTPNEEPPVQVMKPRMVAVQYPKTTKDGASIQTVNVPLITLVPLSQVELKEMEFATELELSVNGEDLQVSFPKRTAKSQDLAAEGANLGNGGKAKLEVKIAAMETPDGLRYLVDGYERALRSQIPG
jgi:hypothetical protein